MAKRHSTSKSKLQHNARRVVGVDGTSTLVNLFDKVAAHLGTTWSTKDEGYALLARLPSAQPVERRKQYQPLRAPTYQGDVNDDAFLLGYQWRSLRMLVLKERGARCECCGATPKDGIRPVVAHFAEHLQVLFVQRKVRILPARLDVVNVNTAPPKVIAAPAPKLVRTHDRLTTELEALDADYYRQIS